MEKDRELGQRLIAPPQYLFTPFPLTEVELLNFKSANDHPLHISPLPALAAIMGLVL